MLSPFASGSNSTTDNKRGIVVKFVNRKHSKLMLRSKEINQLAQKVKYKLSIRYVSLLLLYLGKMQRRY